MSEAGFRPVLDQMGLYSVLGHVIPNDGEVSCKRTREMKWTLLPEV